MYKQKNLNNSYKIYYLGKKVQGFSKYTTGLLKTFRNVETISLDLETNGLDPHINDILSITISIDTYVFIFDYNLLKTQYKEDYKELCNMISNKIVIGHRLQFDYKFLKKENIYITKLFDTYVADKVLYSGIPIKFSLVDCLNRYKIKHPINKKIRQNFIGKSKENINFTREEIIYCIYDVIFLKKLKDIQLKLIKKNNLLNVVNLEFYSVFIYGDIEYNGIFLNKNKVQNIIEKTERTVSLCEKGILLLFDNNIILNKYINNEIQQDLFINKPKKELKLNLKSTEQIKSFLEKEYFHYSLENIDSKFLNNNSGILYKDTPETIIEMIKSGEYNGANWIYPFCRLLCIYRESVKLLSTYGNNLIDLINPITNRIHSNFNPLGSSSGRVTSNNPNLQNIPSEDIYRNCFEAQHNEGLLFTADYSGCELRIIADGSGDESMINAFNNDEDVHSNMASLMFGVPVSKTENKDLRFIQKTINFGLAYGAGANTFCHLFENDLEKTKKALDTYYNTFPKIKNFLDNLSSNGLAKGKTESFKPFNRIRWLYKLRNRSNIKFKDLSSYSRISRNHPIQATNADIIKLASLYIREYLIKNGLYNKIIMVNQVHDEIVLEIINANFITPKIYEDIVNCMIKAGQDIIKKVKIEVDYSIDKVWKK